MTMNIRLDLRFDGTNYHGWQIQPGKPTVQGILKDALFKVTGEDITPNGCGRTDSGVHASGYVCNFETSSAVPCDRLPYALNTFLPEDIVCVNAECVPDDFSSSYSAKAKTYRYTIDNSTFSDVFMQRFAWHYKYALDIDKMRRAGQYFLGTHDFIGFAKSGFTVKTTVRTIYDIKIEKNNDIITIDVTGNGFLYNMVRIIAGTLVFAGAGKLDPDSLGDIIESRSRSMAGITAPAKGLCLREVFYE